MQKPSDTPLLLDLSQHCIETAARLEHRRLLEVLLAAESVDPDQEMQLTLLQEFLETTDCRGLRTTDPRLAGGKPVNVALDRDSSGRVKWWVISEERPGS